MPKLSQADAHYLSALLSQYRQKKKEPPLVIGQNFFPSAVLAPAEREDLLGAKEYTALQELSETYRQAAKGVSLTLNPMNGGIGSSLKREDYLRKIWRRIGKKGAVRLGAKGSDLYFEVDIQGARGLVSISEAKILRVIEERHGYGRIILEELASSETRASIRELFDTPNLFFRLGIPSPWGKMTYAQILSKTEGLKLKPPLIQAAFPTIDEKGRLSNKRVAPGGHGYWGSFFLMRALDRKPSAKWTEISAIYNEDGINNLVDPVIVGWMAREKVPLVMLTTTKTAIDKKGGLIGVLKVGGISKKEIMEEAQAKAAGQAQIFEEMGLGNGKQGAQYFNTNTALINNSVLGPFLKDLAGRLGRAKVQGIVTPKLIQNRKTQVEGGQKRSYIQLEGALGSSLLMLDGFLQGSRDPAVRSLLKKHGFAGADGRVRFLRIVNVDPENRIKFFTPIKTAEDFWVQFLSGAYRFSTKSWMLEAGGKPKEPPRAGFELDDL